MTPDLNDVQVFARVVETGSFSAAAKRLNLPKSTVSRRVMRLEKALGARLLQRTTRKLNLTDAGNVFYGHCARVLSELETAHEAVSRLEDSPRGVLRVTAPNDLGRDFLAALIAEYVRRYPEVSVVVELSTRTVDLVAEGYDVAIRGGTLQDSSLVARRLVRTRSRLYASPGYLETHGAPITPSDLKKHRCLLQGTTAVQTHWTLHGAAGEVGVEVSGTVASNDLAFLRGAVLAGSGIANLPSITCATDVEAGRLQRVLPTFEGADGGIFAVYPTSQQLSPKVRAFVDLAAAQIGSMDALS